MYTRPMKIVSLKTKTKKIREFNKREWILVHPEHYGHEQDLELWKKKKFFFKATEGRKILGTLYGDYLAGVMHISQLIVGHDERHRGVGKKLMLEAEKLAKRNKLHLIYLKTGVGWKAVDFYKSLGFKPIAKLKNFFEKRDLWLMFKEI